ncbi:hypothetical protein GCM10022389_00080 [Flavobacterium cheonanense]|uniref:Uncharacterized protein n=1 Tax=Flavobacterium cheonanense TaxID=706183 RepID=A0ABP7V5Z2_9FLAO
MSEPISKKKFLKELNDFKKLEQDKKEKVFDLAWKSKEFEIELYWKRAGYFWAFQALIFAGFFSVTSSNDFDEKKYYLHYIICFGFITALAWWFINKGSKTWQRHWEKVVDVLEDYVIGKLYKTNTSEKTYSVSKINELISKFFMLIWLYLLLKSTFFDFKIFECQKDILKVEWKILIVNLITIYIVYEMYFGKGRGRFKERNIQFYRRNIKVN